MLKVLVCINDGLLKIRLSQLLSKKGYQFRITNKPVKTVDLIYYDIVLIHSSYKINDLLNFIENAVLKKLTTIMYITTNINSNPFRKFIEHQNLLFIDENKMDIEINLAIELVNKYSLQITNLKKENVKLKKKLDELQIVNKCKRMLIKEGYTEESAHKYILKYAMENQVNKIEACNRLLTDKCE